VKRVRKIYNGVAETMRKMERAIWKEGIELNHCSTGKYLGK